MEADATRQGSNANFFFNWSRSPRRKAAGKSCEPADRFEPACPAMIAKPESMYPEPATSESMRPSGSGDPAQNSIGHNNSGFALGARHDLLRQRLFIGIRVDD